MPSPKRWSGASLEDLLTAALFPSPGRQYAPAAGSTAAKMIEAAEEHVARARERKMAVYDNPNVPHEEQLEALTVFSSALQGILYVVTTRLEDLLICFLLSLLLGFWALAFVYLNWALQFI